MKSKLYLTLALSIAASPVLASPELSPAELSPAKQSPIEILLPDAKSPQAGKILETIEALTPVQQRLLAETPLLPKSEGYNLLKSQVLIGRESFLRAFPGLSDVQTEAVLEHFANIRELFGHENMVTVIQACKGLSPAHIAMIPSLPKSFFALKYNIVSDEIDWFPTAIRVEIRGVVKLINAFAQVPEAKIADFAKIAPHVSKGRWYLQEALYPLKIKLRF